MAIDESSAFDCVNYTILMDKLRLYKFSQQTINWIDSYLRHRYSYVQIGTKQSRMAAVQQGVPQGSVLGPLLYSLYINELAETVRDPNCLDVQHWNEESEYLFPENCPSCGSITSYTDDATYLVDNSNRDANQIKLSENLENISNKLAINKDKTVIAEIMNKQKRSRVKGQPPSLRVKNIRDEDIDLVPGKSTRLLGCNIGNDLG